MKLILHPGHAKCGSTTIQNFLRQNREIFHKNRILFPDQNLLLVNEKGFQKDSETPRDFFENCIKENNFAILENRLNKISRSTYYEKVIITAENLTNHLVGKNVVIHKLFKKYFKEISVIYYIKPQDAFIFSAWQQWGYKEGFSLEEYTKRFLAIKAPNYFALVREMENMYGKENIIVRPLMKSSFFNQNLLYDFVHNSDIYVHNLIFKTTKTNQSLSPFLCDILRKRKDLFHTIHDERLKRLLIQKTNNSPFLYTRFDKMMPNAIRQIVLELHEQGNHYLHSNYFPEVKFDDFFKIFENKTEQIEQGELILMENIYLKNLILEFIINKDMRENGKN